MKIQNSAFKANLLRVAVLTVFSASVATVYAAPANGFGLNGGYASTSRSCNCSGSSTSGVSVGLDYQFGLTDSLSISPFLQSSGETSSGASGTVGHGIFGAELRYWIGDIFVGGHVASYSEAITIGSATTSATSPGFGVVAGWEKANSGLYFMGQIDSATMHFSGYSDVALTEFRASVGYRFK